MKRNRPPDDAEERQAEAQQIEDRLNELFAHCHQDQRRIAHCDKAIWISDKRHAKVEQNIRITPKGMVKYCPQLGYHYLDPYETLYSLDTNQLLIFHHNLPLSLAEAYQIVIENEVQYREYKVFQQLTRTEYICLRASSSISTADDRDKVTSLHEDVASHLEPSEIPAAEELFAIDNIKLPYKDVLKRLQELGPQPTSKPLKRSTNDTLSVAFDVYKRESFSKKKASQPDGADYHVIVCDLAEGAPPNADGLLNLDSKYHQITSEKLLLALVDDDSSVFFAQYNQPNSLSATDLVSPFDD